MSEYIEKIYSTSTKVVIRTRCDSHHSQELCTSCQEVVVMMLLRLDVTTSMLVLFDISELMIVRLKQKKNDVWSTPVTGT